MSLIFYGYMKYDGSRKLVKIDGNVNRSSYIQLLKDNLTLDLNEGEIFSMTELHTRDRVQHNRVWLIKVL